MNNVIKISDHVFKHKPHSFMTMGNDCKHLNVILDENGMTVKCEDCESNLNPYWVLKEIIYKIDYAKRQIEMEKEKLADARKISITTDAAKKVQKAWKSRTMVPSCPHCHRGIFPTDNFGGSLVNKDIEIRRRQVNRAKIMKKD